MINHHQNSFYSFSVNTYKEICISLDSLYPRDLGGGAGGGLLRGKFPKEVYKIRKSGALDSGPREDLLILLSFYTLVIYHVFTSRSNKCTSNTFK